MRTFLALFCALMTYGQGLPIGSSGPFNSNSNCAAADAMLKLWISADCSSGISPCTAYANNAEVTTWKNRIGNANDLTDGAINPAYNDCKLKTSQINGKPAVQFNTGTNNCGYSFTSTIDSGSTYWYTFAVVKRQDLGTGLQNILGGNVGSGAPNNYAWLLPVAGDVGCNSNSYQCTAKGGTALIAVSNGTPDSTNYHLLISEFSNSGAGNLMVFRADGSANGPSSFSSQTITGTTGFIGIDKTNGIAGQAVRIFLAELIIYTGTSALSGSKITSTESCLKSEYGL